MRRETTGTTIANDLTTEDRETVRFYTAPCHHETVAIYLTKLATHRHVKGDDTQRGYLIADYTKRLTAERVTELQMFNACDYFIEDDSNEFFPSYAKLKKQL